MNKKQLQNNTYKILCLVFSLLILIQNQYIYMYFDDWGYASLSYGWTGNEVGMSYGLKDIFDFLSWHYMNWGGRILYFFFEIVILHWGGITAIHIIQAIIIILIGIVVGKIVAENNKTNVLACVALALILYGTMQIKTLKDGVYWYSASVLYVWPLLPLFLCIYLYAKNQKKEIKGRNILCILLAFLAAFSQEQLAVVMISFTFFSVIEMWCEKKQVPGYVIGMCISSFIGGTLTIFAPGNFKRTGIYPEFYGENFLVRTIKNVGLLINSNVGAYNWVFVFIFTFFCGITMVVYFKSKKLAVTTVIFLCYFVGEQFMTMPKELGIIPRGIWILTYFPALVQYYYKRKEYLFLKILLAGVCSQAMMIVSPTIPIRSHIMMEVILHIILIENITWIYHEMSEQGKVQRAIRLGIVIVGMYAAFNMFVVIKGYAMNYNIHQKNQSILEEVKVQYENGDNLQKVKLGKLYDDQYANMMPYQEGYKFIDEWMKAYYELPVEVEVEWE